VRSANNDVDDVVVDASVFVSRMLRSDAHHAPTLEWFSGREEFSGFFIVPALMPAEVAGAVARRINDGPRARHAVDRLMRLPTLRVVALDRKLGEHAADLAASLGLRGADATYVALARILKVPLVTWDAEQSRRAEGTVETLTPSA
jgi:predicted nucleic acid-binding protein